MKKVFMFTLLSLIIFSTIVIAQDEMQTAATSGSATSQQQVFENWVKVISSLTLSAILFVFTVLFYMRRISQKLMGGVLIFSAVLTGIISTMFDQDVLIWGLVFTAYIVIMGTLVFTTKNKNKLTVRGIYLMLYSIIVTPTAWLVLVILDKIGLLGQDSGLLAYVLLFLILILSVIINVLGAIIFLVGKFKKKK